MPNLLLPFISHTNHTTCLWVSLFQWFSSYIVVVKQLIVLFSQFVFIFSIPSLHHRHTPLPCLLPHSRWPVYCVTSPTKDDRYRGPPPTPPGYQGLTLVNGQDGVPPRLSHLRPPDYSVALQRSKLLQSPGGLGVNHHHESQGQSRPASVCLQVLEDSEDGMWRKTETSPSQGQYGGP